MDSLQQPPQVDTQDKSSALQGTAIWMLSLFALLALGGGGWFLFERGTLSQEPEVSPQVVAEVSSKPPVSVSGRFYLSLQPQLRDRPLAQYSYDILEKRLEKLPIPGVSIAGEVSPDGSSIAYAKISPEQIMQIYVATQDGKESVVTGDSVLYKREVTWSPDGTRLAYVGASGSVGRDTEGWSVYVTDLEGNIRQVTRGYRPLFSPDGKSLLVLKRGGLYLVNLTQPAESKLIREVPGREMNTAMKLSLSSDGTHLAWSDFDYQALAVFSITSWEPFAMSLKKELREPAFWNTFSPDGKYIAFQVVEKSPEGTVHNPKLKITDLGTFSTFDVLDLSSQSGEFFWLTDWK